jgi:uncharacterized membrane protein YgcG
MAMLFSLADRGYIRIVDNPEKRKDFNIVRVKQYDGTNELERMFMDGLFKNATIVGTAGGFSAVDTESGAEIADGGEAIIESKKLYNKFYRVINKIIQKANSSEYKHRYYTKNTALPRAIAILAAIACIACTIISGLMSNMEFGIATILLISVIAFYTPFMVSIIKTKGAVKIFLAIFMLFHGSAFIIPISFLVASSAEYADPFFFKAIIVGVIGSVICIVAAIYMPKLNELGSEYYAQIEGFKKNLKLTVGDSLSTMTAPEMPYAYAILPYALMFGMTAKWMKKFMAVTGAEAPEWYTTTSGNDFSPNRFNTFVTANTDMISSRPSSSSSSGGGGGGGGGGCSGGGGGGGGSGSW